MLALFHHQTYDELQLPSGSTARIPHMVKSSGAPTIELDAALKYAFKAGLISHAEFLAGRDELMDDVQLAG